MNRERAAAPPPSAPTGVNQETPFAMKTVLGALFLFSVVLLKFSDGAEWCVTTPQAPEAVLQEGLDFVCQFGALCSHLRQGQSCSLPNDLRSHTSYAYNIFYQYNKHGIFGDRACDFNGTSMLVYSDPSYDDCVYPYLP